MAKHLLLILKGQAVNSAKNRVSILVFWFVPLWIYIIVYLVTWSNMTFPRQDSGSKTDVKLSAESSDICYESSKLCFDPGISVCVF